MAFMGLSFLLMYIYIPKHGLVDESISHELIRKGFKRAMVSPIFYTIGAICALIFLPVSYLIYTLIAIYYLIPAPMEEKS